MNLEFNYARVPINDFIKSRGNIDGALKFRENNQAEFYFGRDFLQALIYSFYHNLFEIITVEEFTASVVHKRSLEIMKFLRAYIFNWEWNWERPIGNQIPMASRARNFFVKMLVVDSLMSQFHLINEIKTFLLVYPEEQHFYLRINFTGLDVHPLNPFVIEVWNNNFEYENC